MRLDKFIAYTLDVSRDMARKIIKNKQVYLNGELATNFGCLINTLTDIITIDGQKLIFEGSIYLMMNKPKGYLSATKDKSPTILDLVDKYKKYNLFIVGRLDLDSVGLIILTNDGKLAHKITSPKSKILKKYYVEVEGKFNLEDIEAFENGLEIKDGQNKIYRTLPAKLEILNSSSAYISLSEGKYHQVKRMCRKLNKEVVYLKRVMIGELALDENLKEGEYRKLQLEEIELLKNTHKN